MTVCNVKAAAPAADAPLTGLLASCIPVELCVPCSCSVDGQARRNVGGTFLLAEGAPEASPSGVNTGVQQTHTQLRKRHSSGAADVCSLRSRSAAGAWLPRVSATRSAAHGAGRPRRCAQLAWILVAAASSLVSDTLGRCASGSHILSGLNAADQPCSCVHQILGSRYSTLPVWPYESVERSRGRPAGGSVR